MTLRKKNRRKEILKIILEEKEVLLLNITIDNKLNFKKYIPNLCHKPHTQK